MDYLHAGAEDRFVKKLVDLHPGFLITEEDLLIGSMIEAVHINNLR
jgi:hypothetical protein